MACNTGIGSTPIVDGTHYDFRVAGLHNGLALMEDMQTRSYWDHTTGEAIHGPLRGTELPEVRPLLYLSPRAALRQHPEAEIAISKPSLRQRLFSRVFLRRMLTDEGHLPFVFSSSMTEVDPRRPRMELGLGVWWPGTSRFYPMEALRERGGAVIDTLGDRRVLVFVDPGAYAPVAVRTEARQVQWDGEALVLDTGAVIRDLEQTQAGMEQPLELLPQMFTRWYGFSAIFPGCEVYEG